MCAGDEASLFPPFPESPAKEYALRLMERLDQGFDLLDNGAALYGPLRGQMFGVLLCKQAKVANSENYVCKQADVANSENYVCKQATSHVNTDDSINLPYIILKAFSCTYNGQWELPGWVPPCFNVKEYVETENYNDAAIHELTELINSKTNFSSEEINKLKIQRRQLSNESLIKLNKLYSFHCANGTVISKDQICSSIDCGFIPINSVDQEFTTGTNDDIKMLPTGAGDCCAPKLLNYAFLHNLIPISMVEFFYGAPPKSGKKQHKGFYNPCVKKCGLILPYMLGLKIIYRDEYIIVVDKPSGLLSVPGRGENMQDCVVNRVKRLFPHCITQPSVHRLDMDTSGLLILAFTEEAHRKMSIQFEKGEVYKQYIARLSGRLPKEKGDNGTIILKFRLDPDNRPHQVYDPINGKTGITEWCRLKAEKNDKGRTRILFTPKTGRTHQLRLHAAHIDGLGLPIEGDRLYGVRHENERLNLHAYKLHFIHPITGENMQFISEPKFN